jgi:aspartyl-tRNA(Asn)/glutamyl-tRNA(Gln) amidotransferase subunit B
MPEYKPTIGLEIHAELKTRTKMFCDSINNPEEKHPNVNVCPICMGHPGCLPVMNKKAIESVIRVGLAVGGDIAKLTKFDRKNYFYPDLPKGYQISQYDMPLVTGGMLEGVRIRRIHLEEDTGTLGHDTEGKSLVDYNRAGVPLMELVTEPDIESAEQAVRFAKSLQRILRYLDVSNANMEKGEMRVEVNISLNMGTKVELKNINSFRTVEAATAYEIKRQADAINSGEELKQETRGWDESKKITFSQRLKENAHDYRYFPEPDLPAFETKEFGIEKLRAELPELPDAKKERFASEYNLSNTQAEFLVEDKNLADYFEAAISELKELTPDPEIVLLYNYLSSDLQGLLKVNGVDISETKVNPEKLASLVALIIGKKITSRQAKDILLKVFDTGENPEDLVGEGAVEGDGLFSFVKEAIAENPNAVADYKKGKTTSIQFLIGQVMKKTKGAARPDELKVILEKELSA